MGCQLGFAAAPGDPPGAASGGVLKCLVIHQGALGVIHHRTLGPPGGCLWVYTEAAGGLLGVARGGVPRDQLRDQPPRITGGGAPLHPRAHLGLSAGLCLGA